MVRLIVTEGDESRVVECGEALVGIGRGAENAVRISDEGASRNHCRIQREADGAFKLYDLASRNGTRLNGQPIEQATLAPGDRITVGNTTILVDALSPDHPTVAEAPGGAESEARVPGSLALVFLSGSNRGRSFPVTAKITSIGRRGRDNDIAVFDRGISNRHAEIRRTPDGFMLVDVGSRNGTFLNGERVSRAPLKPGDRIKLGATLIEVREPGVEPVGEPLREAGGEPAGEPPREAPEDVAATRPAAAEAGRTASRVPYLVGAIVALAIFFIVAYLVRSRGRAPGAPPRVGTALTPKPSSGAPAARAATRARPAGDALKAALAEAARLARRKLYGRAIERLEEAADRFGSAEARRRADEVRGEAKALLEAKLRLVKRAELSGAPAHFEEAIAGLEAIAENLRGSGLEARLGEAVAEAKKAREGAAARGQEAQAARLVARAREHRARKEANLAALGCREVLARFPATAAAEEARKLLAELEKGR